MVVLIHVVYERIWRWLGNYRLEVVLSQRPVPYGPHACLPGGGDPVSGPSCAAAFGASVCQALCYRLYISLKP